MKLGSTRYNAPKYYYLAEAHVTRSTSEGVAGPAHGTTQLTPAGGDSSDWPSPGAVTRSRASIIGSPAGDSPGLTTSPGAVTRARASVPRGVESSASPLTNMGITVWHCKWTTG